MRRLVLCSRVLMIGTEQELVSRDDYLVPFAILFSITHDRPSPEQFRVIEAVAASANCLELSFVGSGSEVLHDYADQIAEENGRIDLVTTWHEDEPLEDVAHYFLNVAGGTPDLLLAVVEEGNPVRQAIEKAAQNKIGKRWERY